MNIDNKDKNRAVEIFNILKDTYPDVKPALDYSNPFELLIATILSAQCTDARVNIVTKTLFEKYKSPEDFINAQIEELEREIYSTGFYKQKAKSIISCCNELVKKFNSVVPSDFIELTSLSGVGRKTASVVAGNAFGIPTIAVDTHVKRLSNLLGFAESDNPDKIELKLKELLPESYWINSSHWLATHGRTICNAKKPKCDFCNLTNYCIFYKKDTRI
ncbi:MAG: endonuclease III [Melioribacteraceae bacterium]